MYISQGMTAMYAQADHRLATCCWRMLLGSAMTYFAMCCCAACVRNVSILRLSGIDTMCNDSCCAACVRDGLAALALDAYPDAYGEFKQLMLTFVFPEVRSEPVVGLHDQLALHRNMALLIVLAMLEPVTSQH